MKTSLKELALIIGLLIHATGVYCDNDDSNNEESNVNNDEDDDASGEKEDLITYVVDVLRFSMMLGSNSYVKFEELYDEDANITFFKRIDDEESFIFYSIELSANGMIVWKAPQFGSIDYTCDDSWKEGTMEHITYDIINKMFFEDRGCPVEAGAAHTMPPELKSYEMKFTKKIPCGEYSLEVWLQTPIGTSAGRFWFDWSIPKGSNCLPETGPI